MENYRKKYNTLYSAQARIVHPMTMQEFGMFNETKQTNKEEKGNKVPSSLTNNKKNNCGLVVNKKFQRTSKESKTSKSSNLECMSLKQATAVIYSKAQYFADKNYSRISETV